MEVRPAAVKRNIQLKFAAADAAELPLQIFRISLRLREATEDVGFPLVPQHRFSKPEPEGHIVDQRFQCAHLSTGPKQIRVGPGP